MLKKGQLWGATIFGCEVACCGAAKASNSDLPPGWGVRPLMVSGVLAHDAVLCTEHRKRYDAGERHFALKGRDERAKFIG